MASQTDLLEDLNRPAHFGNAPYWDAIQIPKAKVGNAQLRRNIETMNELSKGKSYTWILFLLGILFFSSAVWSLWVVVSIRRTEPVVVLNAVDQTGYLTPTLLRHIRAVAVRNQWECVLVEEMKSSDISERLVHLTPIPHGKYFGDYTILVIRRGVVTNELLGQ